MSIDLRLHQLGRNAQMRRAGITILFGAPLVLFAIECAARVVGWRSALAVAAIACVALIVFARRAMQSIDEAWIARRLDAESRLEDSADLLFRDVAQLSPLQQLQRGRLERRLEADPPADIAPEWPWRMLGLAWGLALVAIAMVVLVPQGSLHPSDSAASVAGEHTHATEIDRIRLDIAAPEYTRLASHTVATLETRVPEGSRVDWRLHFVPPPKAATLNFHDGSRVELKRDGDAWIGTRTMIASALYRIVLDGAPPLADDRLYRLDAIADQAPDVRVIQPEKSLTLLADGQHDWDLVFEASDDYAISAAGLTITLAQGDGENIKFKEQTLALLGEDIDASNPGRHQRYRHRLDLAALGIAKGDDVIVRLAVSDNRQPKPNTTKSASFILRWPPENASDSVGMEGLVERTMPAYFRSQRQIIIDTETLIADQPNLVDDAVLARSDGIGVDQKILRLRYGQFLGEESETRSEAESPAEKKPPANAADAGRADALTKREGEHKHFLNVEKFGDAGAVTAEYGHVHDVAEAATLIDPETKAILKSALNEMWDAELHLRQGRPAEALPFENKALGYIKQVQQSSRIYLARVGLELPAVDESRRLSGDRKGVTDRESALAPADTGDSGALALWQVLDEHGNPDMESLERWVRARTSKLPDSLALLAATDRVRHDPACEECRRQLRTLLWPLLPQPATAVETRVAPDASGRAYLDALRDTKEKSGSGTPP
ncbi:MAG TPA: DUF4175 family protein [Rhodanobacteraceae bacterium]|jgi:hypothetical protein|nr:DUF4175 family protein [Rhodanobacteraceae bacterium]